MTESSQPNLVCFKSRQDIAETIKGLAAEIRRDYAGKPLLVVGILKGSFIFIADLIRELGMPVEVEFVILSSYGHGTVSSGKVKMEKGIHTDIKGKHVLVVEDIVDSGHTINYLMDYLRGLKPLSYKLCVLADKPSRRKVPVMIDYAGFTVPNKFIVGYGIDWDEQYRALPEICFVENRPTAVPGSEKSQE
jgi:hypoxanthine phosphoribosyltransferase